MVIFSFYIARCPSILQEMETEHSHIHMSFMSAQYYQGLVFGSTGNQSAVQLSSVRGMGVIQAILFLLKQM